MTSIAAWEVGPDDVPQRIPTDQDFLEKHLEGWIESDPSLLAGDVRWVSRQLTLPDRSRLDLLGLSNDGTWLIAELKPGPPGAGAVYQALHYFTQIASMTNGELARRIRDHGLSDESTSAALDELEPEADDSARDYLLLVAGVGGGEAAQSAADVLTSHGFDVPLRVVTFQVLRESGGRRILLRDIEEAGPGDSRSDVSRSSRDNVFDLATRCGVGPGFEAIRRFLLERGYREYRRRTGLNFNLGSRTQCLWVRPAEGEIHFGYLEANFPILFGVDESQARADLGPNWIDLPSEEALERIRTWADVIDEYRGTQPLDEGHGGS